MAGNIKIIEPEDNFKRVSKRIILDDKVDVFSLGLYVKVLALGKKWDLNITGLAKTLEISTEKIRRSFAVLEAAGFLRRRRVQDGSGRFTGWDYEVSAEPFPPTSENTDIGKNRHSENTDIGKNRISENPTQYKDLNINKDLTNKTKTLSNTPFIPPTIEQVAEYAKERGFTDPQGFARHFVDYYTIQEHPWHLSNGKPMKDWKRAVITWEPDNKFRIFKKVNAGQWAKTTASPLDYDFTQDYR